MMGKMDSHENKSNKFPDEWKVGEVVNFYKFTRKPRDLQINPDQEIPFIPMDYISEDTNKIKGWQMKKLSEISSGTFIFKHDLIVAKITPSFENGKQAILDNLPDDYGYATTEVWALHPKDDSTIVEHLYNYLKVSHVRSNLASRMEGSTGRQRLPRHVLENLEIPVPPLYEQKKIAHVLQTVQEAKEKTEGVIKAAKELKKSLMKHLFTYGPVSVEEAEKVPLKETEIGRVPEEWIILDLGKVCEPRKETIEPEKAENMPYVGLEHIVPGEVKLNNWGSSKDIRSTKNIFYPGDILYGKLRPYLDKAVIADVKGICSTDIIVLKNFQEIINDYLANIIHTNRFLNFATMTMTGVNHPRTSWTKIKELKIPLPPISEQEKIGKVLSTVDKKIEAEENKKKALEQLFNTLLHNLMTAEIRVNMIDLT